MSEKPVIIISGCLEFAPCRWNAQMIGSSEVRSMKRHIDFRPVCPEMEIGLGTPRKPIRVVEGGKKNRLVQLETNREVTGEMDRFCETYLSSAGDIDGFLLKAASPSCGPGDVKLYRSGEKGSPVTGKVDGLFARAVKERFPGTIIETEGRLTNFTIREHFLTRIHTSASFRNIRNSGTMNDLVRFHTSNKYLFLSYNESAMREGGRIVANHEHLRFPAVIERYAGILPRIFSKISRLTSNINVLMHCLGYFSGNLNTREKAHFLDMLEDYRAGRVPLSACTAIMKSWIARFENSYLAGQTFFEPFPGELTHLGDSGQGRPAAELNPFTGSGVNE